jgi:ketosteroid isomerase-like protein
MKTPLFACILLLLAACTHQSPSDPGVLIATDEAFSRMSAEKGLNAAFIAYAADSVVKMREGKFPITGKKSMSEIYLARPDTGMVLTWHPEKAEIAASGDLGYTFGNWELFEKASDTTFYGNYISVWRKQADGSWKYVLDAGCNTPKPANSPDSP